MSTEPSNEFLAHIFHPKTNAKPTGLRKDRLVGKNWNRRRLTRYNKMTAVQQQILKQSGLRNEYLSGNTTLTIAKQQLRPKAIQAGIAKPLRTTVIRDQAVERIRRLGILSQINRPDHRQRPINVDAIRERVDKASAKQLRDVMDIGDLDDFDTYRDSDIFDLDDDEHLLWYH